MKFVIVVLLEVASRDARSISFQEGRGTFISFSRAPEGKLLDRAFLPTNSKTTTSSELPFWASFRRTTHFNISLFFFGSRDLSPFTDTDSREVIGSGSIIACAESQLTKSPATSETLFASTHQCRVCTSDFSLTTCKSDHADHIGKLMHAWQILVPGCSTSCSVTLLIHVALELHVHVHVCTCTSRVHAHSFPVVEWTTRDLTCRITGVVEWFPSCRADHS